MSSSLVKVDYNGDIRIVNSFISYEQLVQIIRETFNFPITTELIVTYQDVEGDKITVTQSSLNYCFQDFKSSGTKAIKFYVQLKNGEQVVIKQQQHVIPTPTSTTATPVTSGTASSVVIPTPSTVPTVVSVPVVVPTPSTIPSSSAAAAAQTSIPTTPTSSTTLPTSGASSSTSSSTPASAPQSSSSIQSDLYALIQYLQSTPSLLTAVPTVLQSVLDAIVRGDNAEQIMNIVLTTVPALKENASLIRLLDHAKRHFAVANQHLVQLRAILIALDPVMLNTMKSIAIGMISQYFFRFTQYRPEEIIALIQGTGTGKGYGCAFSNMGSDLFAQFAPLLSTFTSQFGGLAQGLFDPFASSSSSNATTNTTASGTATAPPSSSSSVEPIPVPPVETSIHPDVSCDGCQQSPLQGIRYKCLTCDNFDYCSKCEAKNDHDSSHSWLKIFPPSVVEATTKNETNTNTQVHNGVTCDVCGQSPIIGVRWKCVQENWDCCGSCEKKNAHNPTHRLVQVPADASSRCFFGGRRFGGGFGGGGRVRHHHHHHQYNPNHHQYNNNHHHPGAWKSAGNPAPEGSRCPAGGNWRLGFGRTFGGGVEDEREHERQDRQQQQQQQQQQQSALAAKFIDDVNYSDRTIVPVSSTIVKSWRVQNIGNAAWPSNSKLVFLRGDREICTDEEYNVPIAQPGEIVEVNAALVLPSIPGRCSAYFRLATANRETFFGPRLWVDLLVSSSESNSNNSNNSNNNNTNNNNSSNNNSTNIVATPTTAVTTTTATTSTSSPSIGTLPIASKVAEAPIAVAVPVPVTISPSTSTSPSTASQSHSQSQSTSQPPSSRFQVQHEMLSSMGFNERNVNEKLLEEENGNLQAVVHRLLSQVKSSWN